MLDDLKKIHERDAQDALGTAEKQATQYDEAEFPQAELRSWLPTSPTKDNRAKQIALECIGRSVVIYASPLLHEAADHWKRGFNERARQLAWIGELSATELLSWTQQPQAKPYAVIELVSESEPADKKKLFADSARALSGLRPEPIRVHPNGHTPAEQLAWARSLGDFVTIYTALLNGINPTPDDALNKFKSLTEKL